MTLNEYLEARKSAYVGFAGSVKGAIIATKTFRGILDSETLLDQLLTKLDDRANELDTELNDLTEAYMSTEEP